MGHFERDFEGDFDEACVFTFFIPRGLIDEFFDAVLFDGVDVFDFARLTAFPLFDAQGPG